jgi:hypothetical protein
MTAKLYKVPYDADSFITVTWWSHFDMIKLIRPFGILSKRANTFRTVELCMFLIKIISIELKESQNRHA